MGFRVDLHADIATSSFFIRVLPPQAGRSTTGGFRVILGPQEAALVGDSTAMKQPARHQHAPTRARATAAQDPTFSLLPMEEVGCGSPLLRSKRRSCASDQRHADGGLGSDAPTASRLPCGERAWSGFVLHRRSQNPAGNQWRPNQERLMSTCRAEGCLAAAPDQLKRRHRPACPSSRQSSDWQSIVEPTGDDAPCTMRR